LLQDVPPTLRLSFPDVVFPGEKRNELYIKLWSGEFMGSSTGGGGRLSVMNLARGQVGATSMNVEVVMEVRDEHGALVENVISQGSGEPLMSRFYSMVFQRNNEPTFGELIKLILPNKENFRWHLFFTFRNRSAREKGNGRSAGGGGGGSNSAADMVDKPFAFSFLSLSANNRNILDDGSYTMVLYKADRLAQLTAEMYLAMPSVLMEGMRFEDIKMSQDMLKLAFPLRDSFTIRSSLCSAKYTQNPVLFSLLRWESLKDPEALSLTLAKFIFLEEIEIVKFLRDIFDSLFGILVSPMSQFGDINLLVFKALVNILRIVQDRRFSNFLPVLDVYIERHFRSANCSTLIIKAMNQLLKDPASNETAANLRQSLKVWHYIFKFVARSRELQKAQELKMAGGTGGGGVTIEHLESTFKRELKTHFDEVNRMMSASSPASIIGTQSITLQNFASILPELAKVYPPMEIVGIVRKFAESISPNQKGQIVIWKLIMYLQVVKGFLFEDPESRTTLVEAAAMWIKPHLGKYDENMYALSSDNDAARDSTRVMWLESNRICVTIVAVMLDKIQEKLMDPEIQGSRNWYRKEQNNVEIILQVLPR
jgi:dedicator of cytokinesis protein 3